MIPCLQQNVLQVISPQMLMFAKILQMTSQELSDYISEEMQENPLLDSTGGSAASSDSIHDEPRQIDYVHDYSTQYPQHSPEEWDAFYGFSELNGGSETLYDHLLMQIKDVAVSDPIKTAMRCIVYSLDRNGWLTVPLADIAYEANLDHSLMDFALREVQKLDPSGVGARSLTECLVLQIEQNSGDPVCSAIVRDHIQDLGKKHYNSIAKALKLPDDTVRKACEQIRKMNPKPGASYAPKTTPHYIRPDLVLTVTGNDFSISLTSPYMQEVHISPYYLELMKDSRDLHVQNYLSNYLFRAKNLLQCIEQRQNTLKYIAELIVQWQYDFLIGGKTSPKPMTLSSIAELASVHESTISRAACGKYIFTPKGVYALSDFFSRTVTETSEGNPVSSTQIKSRIQEHIRTESRKKPLSDQKIVNILSAEGICIARRTVAKYRDALGIPPATARKE